MESEQAEAQHVDNLAQAGHTSDYDFVGSCGNERAEPYTVERDTEYDYQVILRL